MAIILKNNTTRVSINKKSYSIIHIVIPLFVLLFFITKNVRSAEYHVALMGSDQTGLGTLQKPWKTPEYGATQLKNEDYLFIHEGVYSVQGGDFQNPAIKVSDSNITIQNYENDVVVIDGGPAPTGLVIGAWQNNGLTIKGLTIKGAVTFRSSDRCVIEKCDISRGGDNVSGWNFGELIYLQNTRNCIIRNNRLHDNEIQSGNTLNSPLIQEYDSWNLTIENNELYNSVGVAIRLKDNPNEVKIRYNYIHDNQLSGVRGANQDPGKGVYIYNNIFKNNNLKGSDEEGGVSIVIDILGWKIYNNTFINNGFADIITFQNKGIGDIQIWNNISYAPKDKHIAIQFSANASNITYMDYNSYYNGKWLYEGSQKISNLFDWQNAGSGFDQSSHTSDPQFVNVKGSTPEGFKLMSDSPCLTRGRGGLFANVQGAYITGNELIGVQDSLIFTSVHRRNPQSLRLNSSGIQSLGIYGQRGLKVQFGQNKNDSKIWDASGRKLPLNFIR